VFLLSGSDDPAPTVDVRGGLGWILQHLAFTLGAHGALENVQRQARKVERIGRGAL
jgi:hypothetical protein